jgi:hypothetical protein
MADFLDMYKPKALNEGVIAENIGNESVVYDTSRKTAHHLNSTLSWIWRRCDGSRTVDDLVSQLREETGIDNPAALVITGLEQLAHADLLVAELDRPQLASTVLSRRAMVASASVVAPLITSMLAPTPAAAKSAPDKPDKNNKGQNDKAKKEKASKRRN